MFRPESAQKRGGLPKCSDLSRLKKLEVCPNVHIPDVMTSRLKKGEVCGTVLYCQTPVNL